MKDRSIYPDTSVFGGCFDRGFEEASLSIFDLIKRGGIKVVISDILEQELVNAPDRVSALLEQIDPHQIRRIPIDTVVHDLARTYITDGALSESSFADALHVAAATIGEADVIVSWNFKHLVNLDRIEKFNSINQRLNLREIDIRSPREFIDYE